MPLGYKPFDGDLGKYPNDIGESVIIMGALKVILEESKRTSIVLLDESILERKLSSKGCP